MSTLHTYKFQTFNPLGTVTPKPLSQLTSGIDVFSPLKNIPHLEEVAITAGMGLLKGAIIKNTIGLIASAEPALKRGFKFDAPTGPTKAQPMSIVGTSVFGMPVFSNLQIKGGEYRDNAGNIIGQFQDIRIDACIMEVNEENNIITTDIQGKNGTVIEYVSSKASVINIKGRIMTDLASAFPYDDVQNLAIALKTNKSLQIESWFLNLFGIYNIMPKKKYYSQVEGSQEYQKFEFDAIADTPVILKLKK